MRTNEFVIELDNNPGELARICELIGQNGINLNAIATERTGKQVFVRMVVDREKEMEDVLDSNDIVYAKNEVVVKSLPNKPNALTDVAKRLGSAGVNIESLYLAGKGKDRISLVFSLDNPKQGAELLKG